MHTGILSGGEFSAKEKLPDVVADGGEFNIICQNALSSSAISRKNVTRIIVIYVASEIIIIYYCETLLKTRFCNCKIRIKVE